MSEDTGIEYADSTVNAQMGCDGCELWNQRTKVFTCYAGTLTQSSRGQAGFPKDFDKPEIFPGRIKRAAGWKNLLGTDRVYKHWLNGMPRVIFLNDMGDGFTASLPFQYLYNELDYILNAPHIWLMLTKRADRMLEFYQSLKAPTKNIWWGTSVTAQSSVTRLRALVEIGDADTVRWVSYEPTLGPVDFRPFIQRIGWMVLGGESAQKTDARPLQLEWLRETIALCREFGVPVFVKQLGTVWAKEHTKYAGKGAHMDSWEEDLRIREMPRWAKTTLL